MDNNDRFFNYYKDLLLSKDMQYVRSIGGSVSKTWNSINPATLSGAIDVIVVEQEDGTDKSYNHAFTFMIDQTF